MTVQELQEYLDKFPKDTLVGVVFRISSDYEILLPEYIKFFPANAELPGRPVSSQHRRFVLRNGKIMEYDPKVWDPAETPHFIPVLVFPGR